MNTNDGRRFTDAKSLADALGMKIPDAIELAKRADAIAHIGSKTWYDWDKAIQYAKTEQEKHKTIKWFGKSGQGRIVESDVRITEQGDGRFRIRFDRKALRQQTGRIALGTYGDRLYFAYDSDGFLFSKEVTVAAIQTSKIEGLDLKQFVGDFPLHYEGDLMYIEKSERI